MFEIDSVCESGHDDHDSVFPKKFEKYFWNVKSNWIHQQDGIFLIQYPITFENCNIVKKFICIVSYCVILYCMILYSKNQKLLMYSEERDKSYRLHEYESYLIIWLSGVRKVHMMKAFLLSQFKFPDITSKETQRSVIF
jgi:hypothetical protein